MICFYLIWCFGYFLILTWLSRHWPSRIKDPEIPQASTEQVSLIIAFRNESEMIPQLVPELQKVKNSVLEIVLVDDQSEDDSFEKLMLATQEISNLEILKSPGIGKKAALDFGIQKSKGKLIVTSDADCEFTEPWISELVKPFQNSSVQLVAGPVITRNSFSFFSKFQQLEWASILLLTQFSFQKGSPLMCSGANLAFRKSAFDQVKGYAGNEHLLSGDDEFLLKKVRQYYGRGACVFLPNKSALVETIPLSTWQGLVLQRIRWAGKWKLHRSVSHAASAGFAFMAQLVWLASFLLVFVGGIPWWFFLAVWALKVLGESIAFTKVLKSFNLSFSWPELLVTSLIHPFFVVGVALGTIRGKFTWKGRSN